MCIFSSHVRSVLLGARLEAEPLGCQGSEARPTWVSPNILLPPEWLHLNSLSSPRVFITERFFPFGFRPQRSLLLVKYRPAQLLLFPECGEQPGPIYPAWITGRRLARPSFTAPSPDTPAILPGPSIPPSSFHSEPLSSSAPRKHPFCCHVLCYRK